MPTRVKRKQIHRNLDLLPEVGQELSNQEVIEMVHELRVHQVELEAQNKELRDMQHRLEKVRDKYADLFEYAPVGYIIIDKRGNILNVNITGCNLFGFVRNQIIGKPLLVFFNKSEDASQLFFKHLKDVFSSNESLSNEFKFKRKGGKEFVARVDSIKVDKDEENEEHCRMVITDLSGEKKTEELEQLNLELKKEKETAQMFLDTAATMFVLIDKKMNVQLINQKGYEILGYERDELLGKNWLENVVPKKLEKSFLETFNMVLRSKSMHFRQQSIVLTKRKEERLIVWNNSIIKDEKGKVVGILSSGEDITDKKRAEDAMEKSEKLFRALFESATEAILIIDKFGKIVNANPITEKLFGYEKTNLFGKSIEGLIPERFLLQYKNQYINYVKNPRPIGMGTGSEYIALKKDGSEFPVEISVSNIRNDKEVHLMALITDITLRKLSENKLTKLNEELELKVEERTRALQESQEMYKLVARNFPNGVINVFDKDLNYVFVEGMEMFKKGITGDMLIGTNFLERVHHNVRADLKKKLMQVFRGENMSFELNIEKSMYMINSVPLYDFNNKITQILMVTQNITSLKEAEEGIKQSLKQEKFLNELKSRFVSMASHEFRTPLASIMNSTTLLSKYVGAAANEKKQEKQINRIKYSIIHLTNILNDFLSLDKLEEGKMKVSFTELVVPVFFHEFIDTIKNILKKGQSIQYRHYGDETVTVDKPILRNILNNLLSNAIKYSPENSSIEFETKVDRGELLVLVQDHGIGIPIEEQCHLFDRFFRAQNALNIQGTGLGLNIVKKYLDIIGGEIWFKSEPNKGTIFTVRIHGNNK